MNTHKNQFEIFMQFLLAHYACGSIFLEKKLTYHDHGSNSSVEWSYSISVFDATLTSTIHHLEADTFYTLCQLTLATLDNGGMRKDGSHDSF